MSSDGNMRYGTQKEWLDTVSHIARGGQLRSLGTCLQCRVAHGNIGTHHIVSMLGVNAISSPAVLPGPRCTPEALLHAARCGAPFVGKRRECRPCMRMALRRCIFLCHHRVCQWNILGWSSRLPRRTFLLETPDRRC